MKMPKYILMGVMAISLAMGPTQSVHAASNVYDTWKQAAIVSPTSGALEAAGDIDVSFKTLQDQLVVVDHYDVYADDVKQATLKQSNDSTLTADIYVTKTQVHTLEVNAVTKDGYTLHASTRKFTTSKKGVGLASGKKMDDMNISWYYNWSTKPSANVSQDKEFVPMVWNNNSDAKTWLEESAKNYKHVLGVNEPDRSDQANMTTDDAAAMQVYFTKSGIKVGSAVVSYDPSVNDWFKDYMKKINTADIDFIPIHVYYEWGGEGMANAFLKVLDDTYNAYHKPLWVTEYGLANSGLYQAGNTAYANQIEQYMKDTIAGMESRDFVERYSWFSFGTNDTRGGATALYDEETGALTDLGKVYKTLGNPDTSSADMDDTYITDSAYFTSLKSAITRANKVVASNEYINDFYKNTQTFKNSLEKANTLLNSTISSQTVVNEASEDLNKQIDSLELKSGDYSALDALIKKAEDIKNSAEYSRYVDVASFTKAYDQAKSLARTLNIEHQNEIDETSQSLQEAIAQLSKKADYSALDTLIKDVQTLQASSQYSDYQETLSLNNVLNKALSLDRNLEGKNQSQVDEIYNELKNAKNNLKLKDANYEKLNALIQKVNSIRDSSTYKNSLNKAELEQAYLSATSLPSHLTILDQDLINNSYNELSNKLDAYEKQVHSTTPASTATTSQTTTTSQSTTESQTTTTSQHQTTAQTKSKSHKVNNTKVHKKSSTNRSSNSVKTGDSTDMTGYILVLALMGLIIFGMVHKKHHE